MIVKSDTKEKFHVITFNVNQISATMTEELAAYFVSYLQNDCKNIVVDMANVESLDELSAEFLVKMQQRFYENNASFVICGMQKPVEDFLEEKDLLEMMNVTPTESEAWDIVQMEEIERELLGDDGEI